MGKNSSSDSSTSNTSNSSTSNTSSASSSGFSPSAVANATNETGAAHAAGVEGPGLANGNFGSSWSSDPNNGLSGTTIGATAQGNGKGAYSYGNSSYAAFLGGNNDGSTGSGGYANETDAAHKAGIQGPGLQNGNFGSAWNSGERTTKSGSVVWAEGNGNGESSINSRWQSSTNPDESNTYKSMFVNGKAVGEEYGVTKNVGQAYVHNNETGATYMVDKTGAVYSMDGDGNVGNKVGQYNNNGSFIPAKGADIPTADIGGLNDNYGNISQISGTISGASAENQGGNVNEIPTASPGVKVMNGVHDADVESSAISSGSANGNLPTEAGFNNDKAKQEVETQYKNINEAMDENKTNYNRDTWNQGMKETSTEAVSDERCKKFVSTCIKHEPFARQGVKKIVEIIRSK